ncbi:MAG: glycoside hydrolase family 5 protein, partial [Acidimicrobiales bacterium]
MTAEAAGGLKVATGGPEKANGDEEATWLAVDGPVLRDGRGRAVVLRGVSIGGWLNMENFILGYPSTESALREALAKVLGQARSEVLLGSLLDNFFTEKDAELLASLGANVVRLPLNYRHFQDDMRPGEVKQSGFRLLDRAVKACGRHGIYTILDLHALPGSQNHDWHSDNRCGRPLLWEHRDFQDRAVAIWVALADHYRDEPWVAGYNLINEPADEEGHRLVGLYNRLAGEIGAVDPRHVLFLDGNRYAQEFADFGEPLPNSVYAVHHYPAPGAMPGEGYPGTTGGKYYDASVLAEELDTLTAYMKLHNVPVWVGELGPVYTASALANAGRRQLLADQLQLYNERAASWCLWTYKDVGVQGLVRVNEDSPWMRRTRRLRRKKQRLGVDSWGGDATEVQDVMGPLMARLHRELPGWRPYPFGAAARANLLVRHTLFAEALAEEFAALFAQATDRELLELGESFALSSCSPDEAILPLVAKAFR